MSKPKGFNDLNAADKRTIEKILKNEFKTEKELKKLRELHDKRNNYLNPPILSEGAKNYLIGRYAFEKYNARTPKSYLLEKQRPCVTKGVTLESKGIEIVSYLDKKEYKRPESFLENDYLIGVCDALCLNDDKSIIDVKTSWNAANFMSIRRKNKLSFAHWAQMQGYLELYGIESGIVCFVLVNTPDNLIEQERILCTKKYIFGEIDREKYEEEQEKFDSIYNFDKIPLNKRVIRFEVKRNRDFIKLVEKRVELCREYLNEFERLFLLNKNVVTSIEDYSNVEVEEDNT